MDELPFTVMLIDYCQSARVQNPGQVTTTDPVDYYYSDSATFKVEPFLVSPVECQVTYSCAEPLFNLCDYSSESTTATFDET